MAATAPGSRSLPRLRQRANPAPAGPSAKDLIWGRKIFNGVLACSHCHGSNAVVADRRRDLRRLRKRHEEKADEVYRVTVLKGRVKKGRPAWERKISEQEMAQIKAYLDSVQAQ